MANKKPNAAKNISVLLIVALVSVTLLAVINQVTINRIEAAEQEARDAVYQSVYSEAASFEELENFDKLYSNMKQNENCVINSVLSARDKGGKELGFVFDVTAKNGYGGDVRIAVGISNNSKITSFSVIQHSETAGLGSKSTEPEFADQFSGMNAEQIAYSKTGKSLPNEIDAISGATITTNAVTGAVNEAIIFYNAYTEGVLSE